MYQAWSKSIERCWF